MKRAVIFCSVLLATLAASVSQAAERNTFYLGGALGSLKHSADAELFFANTENPQATTSGAYDERFKDSGKSVPHLSLITGFNLFSWLAVELQVGQTLSDKWLGGNLEMQTQTVGLFGVYQKGEEAYFRLRMGLANRDVEFSSLPAFGTQSEVTGAFGASVGQNLPIGSVELMYMYYPKMKIESGELKTASESGTNGYQDRDGNPSGIVFSDRMNTQTIAIAYLYTF